MTLRVAVAGLLALAVLVAWAGIARRWRGAADASPTPAWLALLALQPLAAAMLWLALFPPPAVLRGDRLVVATANTSAAELAAQGAGARVIALPEAPRLPGVARAPDLATALRAAPAPRLRVLGAGLVARDRDAAQGLPVEFVPAPPPPGVTALWLPDAATVGQPLRIAGAITGLAGGRVELRDPGDRVVAQARLFAQGPFALQATPLVAGRLAYTLQLRDARGGVVERVSVPLAVGEGARPRLLLLAGGPSPELKYLRRWALDGGGAVDTRISLGAGVAITGGAPRLDAASLAGKDLAILDARSWRALDARGRATLLGAVREGLGLLVRVDAPPGAAERADWRALGIALASAPARIKATAALPADWLAPRVVGESAEEPPLLARQAVQLADADADGGARALLADADGVALGAWAPLGRGRVGLLWASESFRFALAGEARAYARFWSAATGPLARARGLPTPRLDAAPWRVGQRGIACGLAANARLRGPDGGVLPWALAGDTRTREACAAAWPTRAGWHRITQDGAALDLYVRAADEAPGLRWQADREATQALAAASAARGVADATRASTLPGPGRRWPWFCAWLLLAAAGWGLERRLLPAAPG